MTLAQPEVDAERVVVPDAVVVPVLLGEMVPLKECRGVALVEIVNAPVADAVLQAERVVDPRDVAEIVDETDILRVFVTVLLTEPLTLGEELVEVVMLLDPVPQTLEDVDPRDVAEIADETDILRVFVTVLLTERLTVGEELVEVVSQALEDA